MKKLIFQSAPERKLNEGATQARVSAMPGLSSGRYAAVITNVSSSDAINRNGKRVITVIFQTCVELRKFGALRVINIPHCIRPRAVTLMAGEVQRIIGRNLTREEHGDFNPGSLLEGKPVWLEITNYGRISFLSRTLARDNTGSVVS